MDLEKPSLDLGLERSGRPDAHGILANLLEPLPVQDKFDSVLMYYLLYCIPITMKDK